jgi:hypothetical protein
MHGIASLVLVRPTIPGWDRLMKPHGTSEVVGGQRLLPTHLVGRQGANT